MLKRLGSILLSMVLLLGLLSACQPVSDPDLSVPPEAAPAAKELLELVLPYSGCENPEAVERLHADAEGLDTYIEKAYTLTGWVDGAIIRTTGASAFELAAIRLEDEDTARDGEAVLKDYLYQREGDFTGYAPEQAAILAHSTAVSRGRYAALLICSDPAEARAAFNACFEGPPAEEPPVPLAPRPQEPPVSGEEEQDGGWRYDRQRLLSAWEEGGTGLADRDQVILQSCRDLLGEIITEEMSDYEKELAVHDWMIAWAEYDQAALSALPGAQPTPDSDNPYGFFTGRAAICTGYTSTFQLLMDLLDIECVTVEGTAYNGTEDHAWNMVRLDGDWYCVDVTWDDPVSSTPVSPAAAHMYFNVTSDFMRQFGHQWDEEGVPAAEAGAWAWRG